MSSLMRSSVSGAGWSVLQSGAGQIVTLISFAVMSRFITPDEFGYVGIGISVVASVRALFLDRLADFLYGQADPTHANYSCVFWACSFLTLAAFAVIELAVGGAWIAGLGPPTLLFVFAQIALIFPLMGLIRVQEVWLFRQFRFRALATRNIVGVVAGALIALTLAMTGFALEGLIAQQIVTFLVTAVLTWAATPWRPSTHVNRAEFLRSLRFVRSAAPASMIGVIGTAADIALVSLFFGATVGGLYAFSRRLRYFVSLVIAAPILGVSRPGIANQPTLEGRAKAFKAYLLVMVVIMAPAYFGLSVLSTNMISLCFGAKWQSAAPLLTILCIAGPFYEMLTLSDIIFGMYGKQSNRLAVSSATLLLTIAGLAASTRFGPMAAAWSNALPVLCLAPCAIVLCCRLLKLSVRDLLSSISLPLCSAMLMGLLTAALLTATTGLTAVGQVVLGCISGGLIYAGIAILLWRRDEFLSPLALYRRVSTAWSGAL